MQVLSRRDKVERVPSNSGLQARGRIKSKRELEGIITLTFGFGCCCTLVVMKLFSVLLLLLLAVASGTAALAEEAPARVGEAVPVVKAEEIAKEEPAQSKEAVAKEEVTVKEPQAAAEPLEAPEEEVPKAEEHVEETPGGAEVLHALNCVDGGEKREWAIKLQVPEGAKRLELLVPEGLRGDALVIFEFTDRAPVLQSLASFGPASEDAALETVHPAGQQGAPQSASRHGMSLPEGARSAFVFVGLPGEGTKEAVLAGFSQE